MITSHFKVLFFVFACTLGLSVNGLAEKSNDEQHIEVSMRMIGHQVLLSLGDSTTRVMPIEKEGDRYKIQFESGFQFVPDGLATPIDSVMKAADIAEHYFVEFEECDSNTLVYSYEVNTSTSKDFMPCSTRALPKDCYTIFITLAPTSASDLLLPNLFSPGNGMSSEPQRAQYSTVDLLIVLLVLLIALIVYIWKGKEKTNDDPNFISIGKYQLDVRNMVLSIDNEKVELTSKEAELLALLHTSANNTIERDKILSSVWGDNGDYVGRTLDVFISKLRKKLNADSSVKIVNVRGVGYKLVVNG